MNKEFKPGDKVICINGSYEKLIKGEIYIIKREYFENGVWWVDLRDYEFWYGWHASRFELLETDAIAPDE